MLHKAERRTATTKTVRETEAVAVAFVVSQTIRSRGRLCPTANQQEGQQRQGKQADQIHQSRQQKVTTGTDTAQATENATAA